MRLEEHLITLLASAKEMVEADLEQIGDRGTGGMGCRIAAATQ